MKQNEPGEVRWLNPLGEDEQGPDAKGMYIWAALAGGPLWDIAHGHAHPLWAAWAVTAACTALYVVTVRLSFAGSRRAERLFLPLLGAVAFAATAVFHGNFSLLLVMTAIALGVSARGRRPPILLSALALASLGVQIAIGSGVRDTVFLMWGIFTAGLIPAIMIRLWDAIRELQRTREELARAAVSEERLRFSRDLHDLLGHTLSVMVVKAEAVRRLAPKDADGAARQAADIEQIGREALTEVRAAVTGYRGRGLAAELETARTVLTDAGIGVTVRTPVLRLPPETDVLLGWAVREGVTNVIRHSGARSCEIDLREPGGLVLEIRDDGACAPGPAPRGNGLVGLGERVAAADGTLDAGPRPGAGFLLRVTLPERGESA
ncbi:sensor histidine kinase [Planotetraspora kaengkrachanensis]|uniref:Two-component sensor histidine kinase n=1 Tax=Planotetraspora kaengkrachanensis TaxID=575193 RepID=A0A8J3VBG7_9ACTN|nr:sensor histidine kinase [Planotetraspora kaengkrachanensis]GIG83594.1 two-component sensor histidine kinase [Planotetraspora kaengkrachanensis]